MRPPYCVEEFSREGARDEKCMKAAEYCANGSPPEG